MEAPFDRWLARVVGNEVVTDADDILREAHENLELFAPRSDELRGVSVGSVTDFLGQLIRRRHEQLHDAPMTLYCWHDGQAGQLRVSMVSTSHQKLPFKCMIHIVATPEVIARSVVEHDWHAKEAPPAPAAADSLADDEAAFVLSVFAVVLHPLSLP
jgi:hypothetical protein